MSSKNFFLGQHGAIGNCTKKFELTGSVVTNRLCVENRWARSEANIVAVTMKSRKYQFEYIYSKSTLKNRICGTLKERTDDTELKSNDHGIRYMFVNWIQKNTDFFTKLFND